MNYPREGMGDYVLGGNSSLYLIVERLSNYSQATARVEFETFVELGKKDDIKALYEGKNETQQKTNFNIDKECNYKNIWKKPSPVINKTSKQLFDAYFIKHCKYKKQCILNPDNDYMNIAHLVKDECKYRIQYQKITSYDYILVVGCQEDQVTLPFVNYKMHKQKVGILIVILDVISVIFMAFQFQKLRGINDEYLEIMDDLRVQMKDFGVSLHQIKLDRYTQDSRIQKMRIWLHFSKVLKRFKEEVYEDSPDQKDDGSMDTMEVIDVNLSIYTQPSI